MSVGGHLTKDYLSAWYLGSNESGLLMEIDAELHGPTITCRTVIPRISPYTFVTAHFSACRVSIL